MSMKVAMFFSRSLPAMSKVTKKVLSFPASLWKDTDKTGFRDNWISFININITAFVLLHSDRA